MNQLIGRFANLENRPPHHNIRMDVRQVLTQPEKDMSNRDVQANRDRGLVKTFLHSGASLMDDTDWTRAGCQVRTTEERLEYRSPENPIKAAHSIPDIRPAYPYGEKKQKVLVYSTDASLSPRSIELEVVATQPNGQPFYEMKRYFAKTIKGNIVPIADIYRFANGSVQIVRAEYDPNTDLIVRLTNTVDEQVFDEAIFKRVDDEITVGGGKTIRTSPLTAVTSTQYEDRYAWHDTTTADSDPNPTHVDHRQTATATITIERRPTDRANTPPALTQMTNYPGFNFVLGWMPVEFLIVPGRNTPSTEGYNPKEFTWKHTGSFWSDEAAKSTALAQHTLVNVSSQSQD